MRNNFLEESYTKFGGEASLRPFYKKSRMSLPLDQQSEILKSSFILHKSRSTKIC